MKARLALLVERWFPREVFMELRDRGFEKIGEKTWVVPVERLREFEKITGLVLEASKSEVSMLPTNGNGGREERVEARVEPKQKNGGELSYVLEGGEYHVTLSDGRRSFRVPVEIVETYRAVVHELRARGFVRVKKRDLVALVFERLGLEKYFRGPSRVFHWEAFYGDRTRYHTHYYVPVKILEAQGLLRVTQQDEVLIL